MNIEIKVPRTADSREVRSLMELCANRIRVTMERLCGLHCVFLPEKVTLRILRSDCRLSLGKAIGKDGEYTIAISLPCLKTPGQWPDVIDHECSHIVEDMISGNLSHSSTFNEINREAQAICL